MHGVDAEDVGGGLMVHFCPGACVNPPMSVATLLPDLI